jgi:hypothetical protein
MISTREFNFDDEADCKFAYDILQDRYAHPETLIHGLTPLNIPTYEEHKRNIKTRFSVFRIAMISTYNIGLCYIDIRNYVGFFYNRQALREALKATKIKDIDISKFYLTDTLSRAPKNTLLIAQVSSKNKLANRTASRLMKLVSRSNTCITYNYVNK